jgi:hypothetical protein
LFLEIAIGFFRRPASVWGSKAVAEKMGDSLWKSTKELFLWQSMPMEVTAI